MTLLAELTLLREIRKQFPDLELGPNFEDDQAQSKIGVIGAIPIPIFNSNKGGTWRSYQDACYGGLHQPGTTNLIVVLILKRKMESWSNSGK